MFTFSINFFKGFVDRLRHWWYYNTDQNSSTMPLNTKRLQAGNFSIGAFFHLAYTRSDTCSNSQCDEFIDYIPRHLQETKSLLTDS